jgi:glycosyltransferase involved in cell wall biosynthesis
MGTTPPFVQPFAAWLVARTRRVPFVLEIRDLWIDAAGELGIVHNRRLISLVRRAERFLYTRADQVIVNSPAYVGYARTMGVQANRISVVPNGTTVSMFDPAGEGADLRRRYGLEEKFLVVYAGALGVPNGLESVLDAAEYLHHSHRDVHFLLVGDGKLRNSLMGSASSRRLSNVTFIPAVAKDQIPDILAAADVCVACLRDTPVLKTTYPNKVFDYMAAGRPTVLAIDGAIRSVIEDAHAGVFVKPDDGCAMADAIARLWADPATRRAMGASARRYVAANFDRELQAAEFRELLHRVAAGRKQ